MHVEVNRVVGDEFVEALKKVVEVRESRCEQYGNTYLDDDFLFLKYQVENKMKRFDLQLKRNNGQEQFVNEQVALDSALDAANYALFIIAKILKNK